MNAPGEWLPGLMQRKRQPLMVMVTISVHASHADLLRRTVIMACADSTESVTMQPVAHTQNIRLWFTVTAQAVQPVMQMVMQVLPAAEFGRFSVVKT